MAAPKRRVQTRWARRCANRAIADRRGTANGAIIQAGRDPELSGAVLLRIDTAANALAAHAGLREAGYAAELAGASKTGHGFLIRVRPGGDL